LETKKCTKYILHMPRHVIWFPHSHRNGRTTDRPTRHQNLPAVHKLPLKTQVQTTSQSQINYPLRQKVIACKHFPKPPCFFRTRNTESEIGAGMTLLEWAAIIGLSILAAWFVTVAVVVIWSLRADKDGRRHALALLKLLWRPGAVTGALSRLLGPR